MVELENKISDVIPQILSGEVTSFSQSNCFPNNSKTIKMLDADINKA